MNTFEDLLARDGRIVYKTRGVSMEPMLRQNRDLVVIQVPASRLKKFDVALYKRGDAYVLHRVIRVEDDHYLIRGDHTYALKVVPDTAVIGVLTSFRRKGKLHDVNEPGYRIYSYVWHFIFPVRYQLARLRRLAGVTARKTGIRTPFKRFFRRGGVE